MTTIYILDRCDFTDHWDPNNEICINTARAVQRGAIAGASEFLHRGPPMSFRDQLGHVRTQAELLPETLFDFVGDFFAAAKALIDEGREDVMHWSRKQIDHWLSKF